MSSATKVSCGEEGHDDTRGVAYIEDGHADAGDDAFETLLTSNISVMPSPTVESCR